MKKAFLAVAVAAMVVISGCDKGTTGGPGKDKDKDSLKNKVSQADETFTLSVPSASVKQGESKTVTVKITRGKNFTEDVALKFDGMPEGVTVDPAAPTLKKSDDTLDLTV